MAGAFHRLVVTLVSGTVVAAALGAETMVLWVEEWKPAPWTDLAIAASHGWWEKTRALCLADVHPLLRHWERSLEAVGAAVPPPPPPDLFCLKKG